MILLTKEGVWCEHAGRIANIVCQKSRVTQSLFWMKDDNLRVNFVPEDDILISFLCPTVIPENALKGRKIAINFHPGSPDYPGTGCYNFALHENAAVYGAVCHHMNPKVDTGGIIDKVLFPILMRDTIETLKYRTMAAMLGLFHDVMSKIAIGEPLKATEGWTREPFTRKQLNQLYADFPNTRATRYPDAA